MQNAFSRTELLLGREKMKILADSRVAVFGLGGVGGYVVEALARSGIGALDLIDHDTVDITNINRQILATHASIGRYKAEVAAERVAQIAPECRVTVHNVFYLPETEDLFDFREYDYVVDAIDTVTGKLAIIENAKRAGTPVISSMGAGNKLDPTAFRVSDIYDTTVCPLARVMRRECRKRGIDSLKVVWSTEKPLTPGNGSSAAGENTAGDPASAEDGTGTPGRRSTPGSVAFVPSVAGLILAGEVIRDLTG